MKRNHQRSAQRPLDLITLRGWLTGRLPQDWFTAAPEVVVDRDEITIIGTLVDPAVDDGADLDAARRGRTAAFREDTRDQRIAIAQTLEAESGRAVAWGVQIGDQRVLFTHQAVPVMTRLRQPERQVLDTLVAGGVARSRADALAWCVRLVGQHTEDWLAELTSALAAVEEVKAAGPTV
ncbi:MAG: hypothetical protein LH645_03735 [Actinomycetia bacterium]|nr:hypothetical protein [Actinomycetes bacterium]